MKILFVGDIVARLGRKTVQKLLPRVVENDNIGLVLANAENLARGRGATKKTIEETQEYGVDFFTGGNHIFWHEGFEKDIDNLPVLRPANYLNVPGKGFAEIDLGKFGKVLVISMVGTVFMNTGGVANPFLKIDELLDTLDPTNYKVIIVDFHAEASSEKVLMGHYLDGRVSAVVGTHWHIPTADNRLLPGGTAYVTDVGMVGARDESLGVVKETALKKVFSALPSKLEWAKSGETCFNSVVLTINDNTGMVEDIKRVDVWS